MCEPAAEAAVAAFSSGGFGFWLVANALIAMTNPIAIIAGIRYFSFKVKKFVRNYWYSCFALS